MGFNSAFKVLKVKQYEYLLQFFRHTAQYPFFLPKILCISSYYLFFSAKRPVPSHYMLKRVFFFSPGNTKVSS